MVLARHDCVPTTKVAIDGFRTAGLFPQDANLNDKTKLIPLIVAKFRSIMLMEQDKTTIMCLLQEIMTTLSKL